MDLGVEHSSDISPFLLALTYGCQYITDYSKITYCKVENFPKSPI